MTEISVSGSGDVAININGDGDTTVNDNRELNIPIYNEHDTFPTDGSVLLLAFEPEFGIVNFGLNGVSPAKRVFMQFFGGTAISNNNSVRIFTTEAQETADSVGFEPPLGWVTVGSTPS